jgi:cobalamin-dependent methionine synthase I
MKPNKLIIEVRGGVAEVTASTVPIEVLIVDWDNIRAGEDDLQPPAQINGASTRDFERNLKEIREQVKEYQKEQDA